MARMLFLRDIDVDVHVRCLACGHGGVLPRSMLERRFGPNYPVLSIAPHYRCSRCNSRDTESRPASLERFVMNDGAEPAAGPSFDAPLAALQGLLASVRGPDAAEREPPLPSRRGAIETPGDLVNPTELDDTLPAFKPFVSTAPVPSWQADPLPAHASGKSWRPLEDLVADGPADEDADPLWEPVSLADMAASRGELSDDPPESLEAESFEDDTGDAPHDETLAAMRRLFAEADLDGEEATSADAFFDEAEEEEEAISEVFSHKALVRSDFDEDPDEFGDDLVDVDVGFSKDFGEDEPTEEEILNFAIRDPEKPAPPPLGDHFTKPPAPEEEDGFDKTLAALRSMIEDAATEPVAVPARRKERQATDPLSDTEEARAIAPLARPSTKQPAKPATSKAGGKAAKTAKTEGSKRSAQEREIEEAMKAMRDMVDEDEAPLPEQGEPRAAPKAAGDDPAAEAPSRAGKARADGEASPLSKTIAALRGMLELDGRRKR